jgi:hypothetical protein
MIRKFVFVIDGEVGPDITFEDEGVGPKFEHNRLLAAAMSSDPKVIEIPYDSEINIGWTWDGKEFKKPQE